MMNELGSRRAERAPSSRAHEAPHENDGASPRNPPSGTATGGAEDRCPIQASRPADVSVRIISISAES